MTEFGRTAVLIAGSYMRGDGSDQELDSVYQYDIFNDEWFQRPERLTDSADDTRIVAFQEGVGRFCNTPPEVDFQLK